MDFIDPVKQRKHKIRLFVGYGLISCAIILAAIVLLFAAYGYGVNSKGQIIQSGLVFVSSAPAPATISLNGQLNSSSTNARLQIPAGQYTLKLTRDGYRPWVRSLGVEGGSVEHFDYPVLFPTKIVTSTLKQYTGQPGLTTESPNSQWLLTQDSQAVDTFDEYNLSNPKQLASTLPLTLTVPSSLFSSTQPTVSWDMVSWFGDNNHVILKRNYSGGSEYILFDRQTPTDSVNLTAGLKLDSTTTLSFYNNNDNQYYAYDSDNDTLSEVTLANPQPVIILKKVLAFDAYANDAIIYVSDSGAPTGKVFVNVLQGTQVFRVGEMQAGISQYLVAMSQFSGNWYVAFTSNGEGKVYLYENPVADLQNQPKAPLVPLAILTINQPSFLSFSGNSQILAAQNGGIFATYDILNQNEYSYHVGTDISPTQEAIWMDNYHFTVVSDSKLLVFDYDGSNLQTLQPATVGLPTFFDPTHKWAYVQAPDTSNPSLVDLTSTALRIPADQ